MTEMRILEILAENDIYPTDKRIAAMKQAVNESLDEAAEKADVGIKSGDHSVFNLHVLYKEKDNYEVDKQSIINSKVK